jgi:hypothetical protein
MNSTRSTFLPSDTDAIILLLAAAGIELAPNELDIRQRDDRFAVLLPDDRIAWFAANEVGESRLVREARVLDLVSHYCRFVAPRVLARHPGWQLRTLVPGTVDPWAVYRRVIADPDYADATGRTIGALLAEQHRNIPSIELAWLPRRSSWPAHLPTIAAALPEVIHDAWLLSSAIATMERYEAVQASTTDRVLTHGDLGLHNLAFAADGGVAGVFDYDDAAFSDRHDDFEFLLFDTTDDVMLRAAISSYEAAGGAPIDLAKVALFNAANAVAFLADRLGSSPEDKPAGRTLAEDLRWTTAALARLDSFS